MNKVDTCGMGCPQPVLMTKNALDKIPKEHIIVDNNTARGMWKDFETFRIFYIS